jgi:lipoprotein-releasing system permease protein
MRYELKIALRYLRARRREAFISVTTLFTVIGVMIGVAALTITLSVMGGFEANLRQRVLSLTPQIEIQSYTGAISDYRTVEQRALTVPGINGADPFIVGQAMLRSARGLSGVVVRGVVPTNPTVVRKIGRYVRDGTLGALAQRNHSATSGATQEVVALGAALAVKLKVRVGDSVRMIAPIISGGQLSTRTGDFEVGAIFDSGIDFIDRELVLMNLADAQSFFGRGHQVDGIELHLRSLDETGTATARLRTLFAPNYRVRNWIEFNQAASAGFAMLKKVYSLVLLMLIGVAAFNLVATLIMVVMEKRKDIAVLMTMGASAAEVRLIFILKGLIIGTAGTTAGLILGAIGCFALSHYQFIHIPKAIYGISTLPIRVSPANFAMVALASVGLCLLAAIYPARQASRETPSEVLRS